MTAVVSAETRLHREERQCRRDEWAPFRQTGTEAEFVRGDLIYGRDGPALSSFVRGGRLAFYPACFGSCLGPRRLVTGHRSNHRARSLCSELRSTYSSQNHSPPSPQGAFSRAGGLTVCLTLSHSHTAVLRLFVEGVRCEDKCVRFTFKG